jgi:Domain of unknown function (DUF3459)
LRRSRPDLTSGFPAARINFDAEAGWIVMLPGGTIIACNLAGRAQAVPLERCRQTVLLASASNVQLADGWVELPAESVAIIGKSQPK